MKIRYFMDYKLEDDETLNGGVSFVGETVADFIDEMEISEDEDIEVLNKALYEAGIKPIDEKLKAFEYALYMIEDTGCYIDIPTEKNPRFELMDDGHCLGRFRYMSEVINCFNWDAFYEYHSESPRTYDVEIEIIENADKYLSDVDVNYYESHYLADIRKVV